MAKPWVIFVLPGCLYKDVVVLQDLERSGMNKLCFLALSLLASCAVIPTSSRFADGQLPLNIDKNSVIERYGKPFSLEVSFDKDSVLNEVVYYKEAVRVMNSPFIVTTKLDFRNGKLCKIRQFDQMVKNVALEVDSVR